MHKYVNTAKSNAIPTALASLEQLYSVPGSIVGQTRH